ncbi:MAG TPA: glycosyltransferase family 4 protein [Steroidobacteraceae bacterium]
MSAAPGASGSPRRVAFVSNSASGEYTGRLRWVEPLRARGFDVSFVLPEGEGAYVQRFNEKGVKVFQYAMDRSSQSLSGDLASTRDLVRLIRAEKFDILHSFGHKANLCMGLAAMRLRSPVAFLHVTGLGSPFMPGGGAARTLQRTFLRAYYRLAARKLSGLFFQNRDDEGDLGLSKGARTFFAGSTGVDLDELDPATVKSATLDVLRRELGIEGRVVLTYIGRLLKDKGVPELLQAAAGLHRNDPRVVLLVVGTPDPGNRNSIDPASIPGATDEFARFLGRRDDIKEILALTDIFVNPSSYREGVPRTNLEALAMGKPVVTANGPGCRDTIVEGETGFLIPPHDPRALESALRKLIESDALRARLGAAAREDARLRFSVGTAVDRVASVYQEVLSRP